MISGGQEGFFFLNTANAWPSFAFTGLDIDPQFFTTPHDRETGVAIFRMMRRMFDQAPIADYLVRETRPGTEVEPHPVSTEIVEVAWFPPDALPELQFETSGALMALARASHEGTAVAS